MRLLRVAREGEQRLFECLADSRALHRNQRGVDAAGEGPGHAVVRGDGQLHLRLAGEDDQTHAVLLEPVEELADGVFGPLEAVGLEVFGEHRVRDIDHQHHLDALGLLLAEFRPELRAGRRQCDQQHGRGEEQELDDHAAVRDFGHQPVEHLRAAEAGQPPAAVAHGQPEKGRERRKGGEQPEVLRIGKSEHVRSAFFTVFVSARGSRGGTRPAAAPAPRAPTQGTARGRRGAR